MIGTPARNMVRNCFVNRMSSCIETPENLCCRLSHRDPEKGAALRCAGNPVRDVAPAEQKRPGRIEGFRLDDAFDGHAGLINGLVGIFRHRKYSDQ